MGKYSTVEAALINEIQRYPSLWNPKDADYKNKTAKENSWTAVVEAVNKECNANFSVSDYKDKIWKNIRDTYVRILNGNWKKSGSGTDELPQYPYFQALTFLKPFINIRIKNGENNYMSLVESDKDMINDELVQPPILPAPLTESHSSDYSSHPSLSPADTNSDTEEITYPKRGKKRSMSAKPILQKQIDHALDVKILEYISGNERKSNTTDSPALDAEDAFGKSVSAQLRLMDQKARSIAMGKIQMVLCEGQFPQPNFIDSQLRQMTTETSQWYPQPIQATVPSATLFGQTP